MTISLRSQSLTNAYSQHRSQLTPLCISRPYSAWRSISSDGTDAAANPSDPDYDEDADKLDIPIHAFDVIIADECIADIQRAKRCLAKCLDYFDAVKIGLTATLRPFPLLFKEVIYRYTTDEQSRRYLVDYDAVRIRSNVHMNGAFLKEGEHVGLIDTTTGKEIYDQLEDEREFPSEKIEVDITAPDSNRKIIKEIASTRTNTKRKRAASPRPSSSP